MSRYFSHDVNAQHDDKCMRLLQTLGWKGYGVFWGLIERMNDQDQCQLEYNPKGLAWSLHIAEKFLIRVITEFDLFVFSDDKKFFWSESARRRQALRNKGGRPKKHCPESKKDNDESPKETTDIPKRKRGRPRKLVITVPDENEINVVETELFEDNNNYLGETEVVLDETTVSNEEHVYEQGSTIVPPANEIIDSWNAQFNGTTQSYKGFSLDPVSFQRASESLKAGYTTDDFRKAFSIARLDTFPWILKDVLKPDNIQRLLAKGEKHAQENNLGNIGNNTICDKPGTSSADWLGSTWTQYITETDDDSGEEKSKFAIVS